MNSQESHPQHIKNSCPYGLIGDQLWVRETFAWFGLEEDQREIAYKADSDVLPELFPKKWTPSLHMPRWASRITLEITGVRIERLNDISDEDALAEGIDLNGVTTAGDAIKRYLELWDRINGAGNSARDPYVWVVEFKAI